MNKAVFLDRDGVINRAIVREGRPFPPPTLEELEILPGVEEALSSLRRNGYILIVVTNQPDVGRGKVSRESVDFINDYLLTNLPIDEIRTCFHDDKDDCICRKPLPGLVLDAAQKHGIDLKKSYMVGDRWKDIDAGVAAGCKTIFIDYGYLEKRPVNFDHQVQSLLEASNLILGDVNGKH
jgi:D-glycero-D-manno-heptose 1,7-bisphosphate phosphatase